MKYALFLRGINVGGNTMIKMEDLRKALEKSGCSNVKTFLNSGNAVFEIDEKSLEKVKKIIEEALKKHFGFSITIFLRDETHMHRFIASAPFKNIKATPNTRCLVTFLEKAPWELCNVIEVVPGKGTTELMKTLEKKYGKNITTRTWNTVTKVGSAL